jgi:hypothetical protein
MRSGWLARTAFLFLLLTLNVHISNHVSTASLRIVFGIDVRLLFAYTDGKIYLGDNDCNPSS